MINLLPPKEKKNILDRKIEKLIIIMGGMILFSLTFFISLLFSINFYVETALESEMISLEQLEKDYLQSDAYQLQELIVGYNNKFAQARTSYGTRTVFTDSIERVTSLKPEGVAFKNLSMRKSEAGIIFSVSGFSRTRANLISFRDDLERSESISNINFSPLSWVRPNNVDFQLAFEFNE